MHLFTFFLYCSLNYFIINFLFYLFVLAFFLPLFKNQIFKQEFLMICFSLIKSCIYACFWRLRLFNKITLALAYFCLVKCHHALFLLDNYCKIFAPDNIHLQSVHGSVKKIPICLVSCSEILLFIYLFFFFLLSETKLQHSSLQENYIFT